MKNTLVILGVIFVLGCASNPIKNAPTTFKSSNKTGVIVGTVSIIDVKPRFNSYDIFYRQIDDKNKRQHTIRIKPDAGGFKMVLKPDYAINDTLIFQFIMEHPPGKYEFTNYSLFNNLGYIQSTKKEKKGFSIPFEINEGQISYLGDIVMNTQEFKKDGYLINWLDNSKRELVKFEQRFPLIDWSLFQNRTVKNGSIENDSLIKFTEYER